MRRADHTRRCIRNIEIQSGPLKLGLDEAKQPRLGVAFHLRSGKKVDDLLIPRAH